MQEGSPLQYLLPESHARCSSDLLTSVASATPQMIVFPKLNKESCKNFSNFFVSRIFPFSRVLQIEWCQNFQKIQSKNWIEFFWKFLKFLKNFYTIPVKSMMLNNFRIIRNKFGSNLVDSHVRHVDQLDAFDIMHE